MNNPLKFDILPQPNDISCGPTCLHAIYKYYNDNINLDQLISEVRGLHDGGTLAVFLACHALRRGYQARMYTFNLHMFDPSWFPDLSPEELKEKLKQQKTFKKWPKIQTPTNGYIDFLNLGGEIHFEELTTSIIRHYLKRSIPIITGLSATFLYKAPREISATNKTDDLRGEPVGHFVVFCGYDKIKRTILVADPYQQNPMATGQFYNVTIERAIGAIYLGVLTHDANFLILQPDKRRR